MLEGTTGFIVAALLVIPTCIGLWRGDNPSTTADPEKMKRLLDRRLAHRRRATRTGKNAHVNYFFLQAHGPAQSNAPDDPEGRWDRRARGRRAEDTARGSTILESTQIELDRRPTEMSQQGTLSASAEPTIFLPPARNEISTSRQTRSDPA